MRAPHDLYKLYHLFKNTRKFFQVNLLFEWNSSVVQKHQRKKKSHTKKKIYMIIILSESPTPKGNLCILLWEYKQF